MQWRSEITALWFRMQRLLVLTAVAVTVAARLRADVGQTTQSLQRTVETVQSAVDALNFEIKPSTLSFFVLHVDESSPPVTRTIQLRNTGSASVTVFDIVMVRCSGGGSAWLFVPAGVRGAGAGGGGFSFLRPCFLHCVDGVYSGARARDSLRPLQVIIVALV